MTSTPRRELDHRTDDGIEVTLLWNAHTNCVSVAVADEVTGMSFEFQVAAGDALHAFHHPYTYAEHDPQAGLRAA